jgi:hypothetical protein
VLVASQAISGNLFKSSEDIPGGAVKGALARLIQANGRMETLGAALDRIVVRHAKPVLIKDSDTRPGARPLAIPLSLFSVESYADGNAKLEEVLDDLPPEKWTPGYAVFRSACSGVM